MGACRASYIKIDKKAQKFHDQIALLPAPVLSCNNVIDCDCPMKCDHLGFHRYLRDRVHYQSLDYFEKTSHKKKFKYDYLQMITYLQNFGKNWSEESCGSDKQYYGANNEFDCMTVCVADQPAELMSFLYARFGDSWVGKCENAHELIYTKANKLSKWVNKWAPFSGK